jgi:5,6-dimethylbenzimidazole synthase
MRADIQGLSADTRPTDFDDAFRARLRDLLVWRRDVRRFRRDPLPAGTLERLIDLACLAPSVGLSQPWRFVVVADRSIAQGHGLGRHTMPEMIEYSAVTAVHTIWLAARAEGIGVGWVSILEPASLAAILDVPSHWKFIAYLCLGFPQSEDDVPELARKGWEQRTAGAVVLCR